MPLSNAQTRDVESVLHPYTNLVKLRETGAMVIERGSGVRVYDEHGKDYIEAMSGLWSAALGWGEPVLADVAAEQMKKLSFAHLFSGKSHEPGIALAEKLKEIAPFPVGKVFFANSGSEANDSQIKLMWYAANSRGQKGRKKIIARNKAYHGVTLASASLTGLDAFRAADSAPFLAPLAVRLAAAAFLALASTAPIAVRMRPISRVTCSMVIMPSTVSSLRRSE